MGHAGGVFPTVAPKAEHDVLTDDQTTGQDRREAIRQLELPVPSHNRIFSDETLCDIDIPLLLKRGV